MWAAYPVLISVFIVWLRKWVHKYMTSACFYDIRFSNFLMWSCGNCCYLKERCEFYSCGFRKVPPSLKYSVSISVGAHLLGCQDTLLPSRLLWLCSDCLTVNIHWRVSQVCLKKVTWNSPNEKGWETWSYWRTDLCLSQHCALSVHSEKFLRPLTTEWTLRKDHWTLNLKTEG